MEIVPHWEGGSAAGDASEWFTTVNGQRYTTRGGRLVLAGWLLPPDFTAVLRGHLVGRQLRVLALNGAGLAPGSYKDLAAGLATQRFLRVVCLDGNRRTAADFKMIVEPLLRQEGLWDFSWAGAHPAAVDALTALVKATPTLTFLGLVGVKLTVAPARAAAAVGELATALLAAPRLRGLLFVAQTEQRGEATYKPRLRPLVHQLAVALTAGRLHERLLTVYCRYGAVCAPRTRMSHFSASNYFSAILCAWSREDAAAGRALFRRDAPPFLAAACHRPVTVLRKYWGRFRSEHCMFGRNEPVYLDSDVDSDSD